MFDGETETVGGGGTVPVPDNDTRAVLLPKMASEEIVNAPEYCPDADGPNVTLTEQVAPAPMLDPQLFVETKELDELWMELMASAWSPVFDTETTCVWVVPTATAPNDKPFGATDKIEAWPEPDKFTTVGIIAADVELTTKAPLNVPTVDGWKLMPMLQLAPGASEIPEKHMPMP